MKLLAIIRNKQGTQRIELDGPIEVVGFDGQVGDLQEAVSRHTVSLSVERGSGAHAQSSRGHANVCTSSGGFAITVDVKPGGP